jgi:hypothetical protein
MLKYNYITYKNKNKMKKLIVFILIFLSIFQYFTLETNAKETGYYVVTAYYSPLPNQKYYLKGNYKAEKRLN